MYFGFPTGNCVRFRRVFLCRSEVRLRRAGAMRRIAAKGTAADSPGQLLNVIRFADPEREEAFTFYSDGPVVNALLGPTIISTAFRTDQRFLRAKSPIFPARLASPAYSCAPLSGFPADKARVRMRMRKVWRMIQPVGLLLSFLFRQLLTNRSFKLVRIHCNASRQYCQN
jgi:hypothetical protein